MFGSLKYISYLIKNMSKLLFTVRVAVGDQKLQHLVHGAHEKDEPQLGHRHGDETPQKDGRAHRPTERH